MTTTLKTNADHQDFINLVKLLNRELEERDGDQHEFYSQYNTIDSIKHAIVLYKNNRPLGCGALKHFDSTTMEIKRMYTLQESRGLGVASTILKELEIWAKKLGYNQTILETGKRNPEAIALYQKHSYSIIPNYGQYIGVDNSVCFKKRL